jgi:hypothetical protein
VDQANAQFGLERGEPARSGHRIDAQPAAGGGQAASPHRLDEHRQVGQFHYHIFRYAGLTERNTTTRNAATLYPPQVNRPVDADLSNLPSLRTLS